MGIYRSANLDYFLRTAFPKTTLLLLKFKFPFSLHRQPQPFVNMICLFPALQELDIYRSGAWEEIPTDTVPPPQLRSLVLCENSAAPILAWLDAVDHLPNVRSLTLPPLSLSDLSTVRAALRRLGTALHHLVIRLNERESNGGASVQPHFSSSTHGHLFLHKQSIPSPWSTCRSIPTSER
jgi:hypothetical protein